MGDREGAECAGSFRVHATFRNHFTVEVGELFEKPYIFKQCRAAWTGGSDVLVIDDGSTENGSQFFHERSSN